MSIDRMLTLGIGLVVGLWGFCFLAALAAVCCGGIEGFGQMGDAFNMLNALFAGLAFAVIAAQLWIQKSQIKDEEEARRRAERISALTTRIQTTFEKINNERKILVETTDGFKFVSFMHEADIKETRRTIKEKENYIISLRELFHATKEDPQNFGRTYSAQMMDTIKQVTENNTAIAMLKQILEWMELLHSYEKELDGLLTKQAQAAKRDGQEA